MERFAAVLRTYRGAAELRPGARSGARCSGGVRRSVCARSAVAEIARSFRDRAAGPAFTIARVAVLARRSSDSRGDPPLISNDETRFRKTLETPLCSDS